MSYSKYELHFIYLYEMLSVIKISNETKQCYFDMINSNFCYLVNCFD